MTRHTNVPLITVASLLHVSPGEVDLAWHQGKIRTWQDGRGIWLEPSEVARLLSDGLGDVVADPHPMHRQRRAIRRRRPLDENALFGYNKAENRGVTAHDGTLTGTLVGDSPFWVCALA